MSKVYPRRWANVRLAFLQTHPLCVFHLKQGELVPADVVDHIKPHRGDERLKWDPSNFQALCKPCHDRHKQRIERGSIQDPGEDGWPEEPSLARQRPSRL